jgi:prevent-host-death family protein
MVTTFKETRMETVGVRDLKANLSRYLKRVRAGARLVVTDRGKPLATLAPLDASEDQEWAHRLVAEGRASWSGKPSRVPTKGVRQKGNTLASDAVLEDRR